MEHFCVLAEIQFYSYMQDFQFNFFFFFLKRERIIYWIFPARTRYLRDFSHRVYSRYIQLIKQRVNDLKKICSNAETLRNTI